MEYFLYILYHFIKLTNPFSYVWTISKSICKFWNSWPILMIISMFFFFVFVFIQHGYICWYFLRNFLGISFHLYCHFANGSLRIDRAKFNYSMYKAYLLQFQSLWIAHVVCFQNEFSLISNKLNLSIQLTTAILIRRFITANLFCSAKIVRFRISDLDVNKIFIGLLI